MSMLTSAILSCFNPRTYIRYDQRLQIQIRSYTGFNPRTYIRYDYANEFTFRYNTVSIHVPI